MALGVLLLLLVLAAALVVVGTVLVVSTSRQRRDIVAGEPLQQRAERPLGRGLTRPAGEQAARHDAGGVQVLARLGGRARDLLRCHVAVGADDPGAAGQPHVVERDRDAEVAEPQVRPARLEQQVGRLDVAVHDAGRVDGVQGLQELVEQHRDVRRGQPAVLGGELLHRAAAHQVHREHHAVVLGRPAGRRDDVRVHDPHRLLAHEAQQRGAVVGAEHLGRHQLAGPHVAGPPDRAHAAGADLVQEQVAAGERRGGRTAEHRGWSYPTAPAVTPGR
jgi:hypothetical protein